MTDAAYFYFSKTFGTALHAQLFEKLKAVGLTGNLLKRIRDFEWAHLFIVHLYDCLKKQQINKHYATLEAVQRGYTDKLVSQIG